MSLVAVDSMDYGLKKLEAPCPGKWQNFPSEVLRIRENTEKFSVLKKNNKTKTQRHKFTV